MKKIRSYTSIWSVEKVLYSINDFRLPFPITFTQMTWFVVSLFAVMILGNLPPLSMIEGAFLKYFGIPVAFTWFMSTKTFDGKKPYGCLLYTSKSQAKKEDQKEKEKTIQVLDIKNPVEITYSADDGSSMSFVKEDGTWYLKNDKETALVQDTIQDIADTVSDVKAEKQIKDPDPLESYGLNEASYTLSLIHI